MKIYLNYLKDVLRLALSVLFAVVVMAELPNGIERLMGFAILALVLWLSFLLDSRDPRNHFRAAWILTKQANVEFRAALPADFVRLVERLEKLAKSGITLDDFFPVDGVAKNAEPAVDGVPADQED